MKQEFTSVFGEGDITVILLSFSFHLVLSLPAFVVIFCISSVLEINIL